MAALYVQVEVGFLLVGHTHEDIDQMFSRFAQYLRQNSAHTLPGKTQFKCTIQSGTI